jgi:bromodomain-containing factor 1
VSEQKDDDASAAVEAQNPEVAQPETSETSQAEPVQPVGDGAAKDIRMADTPADSPTEAAEKEDDGVANPAESAAEPAESKPADEEGSSVPKPDVEMADAPSADQSASTQETTAADPPSAIPTDDVNLQPASMSDLAIDASQKSPEPVVATADTSINEEEQPSSVKVARGREDDADEGPAAKRVKTDEPSDGVDLTPAPAEAMDVDREILQQSSLYRQDGKPKTLDDPTLDGNIMNRYQTQKIRGVLAGIKKTKAGGNFRASVESLWPMLWQDYRSKVPEPTDITTMERRLRGGDPAYPPYANLGEVKKDIRRLHENAVRFNGADHFVAAQGKQVVEQIMERLSHIPALEPVVEEKKVPKQHPSRQTEPRPAANPPAVAQPPRRPAPKPAAPSPVEKPQPSPAFAIPPNNNGVPLIRRDSKLLDDRPKRPINPPKSKDIGYEQRKKKLSPELRFCDAVLSEIMKAKHFNLHEWFMQPVDPVALNIPSYYKIIKKPMDLETMRRKLDAGEYSNAKEFEKDFWQIGKNCRLFNGEDSIVTERVKGLEELFKSEYAKKDAWMARHAPPERMTQHERPSPRHKVDSDDDDAESEEEEAEAPEQSEEARLVEELQQRLKEEGAKLDKEITSKTPNLAMVEISQTIVAALQRQLIQARQKLAEVVPVKKPAKKAAQAKKPSGAAKKKGGAGLDASRNTAAGGRKSGGAVKKATKRHMGEIEKAVIGKAVTELEGAQQERAINIIKADSQQLVSARTVDLTPLSLFHADVLDLCRKMIVVSLRSTLSRSHRTPWLGSMTSPSKPSQASGPRSNVISGHQPQKRLPLSRKPQNRKRTSRWARPSRKPG